MLDIFLFGLKELLWLFFRLLNGFIGYRLLLLINSPLPFRTFLLYNKLRLLIYFHFSVSAGWR